MASSHSTRRFMDDSSFRSAPDSPIGVLPDIRSFHGPYAPSSHAYNDSLRSDCFGPGSGNFRSAPSRALPLHNNGMQPRYRADDVLRRRNVEALSLNRRLRPSTLHHQIHLAACTNGHYPSDFLDVQSLSDLMGMEYHRLEQTLSAYGITPYDLHSSCHHSMHLLPRPLVNRAALLEHLDAHTLAEQLIAHRPGLAPRRPGVSRLPWH